ncbi:zinc-dependent alcohol dehydrogenase [Herbidospora mongoliensis]|uniref:zinc-dependent alcohol dehydrogenase n=1 Tax=Herbidospora mongoliensis TaxID=688067 RepID=UPI00082CD78D|nr:alcohol dehydrogenase catalytic domain-containing protein [Herbidospora mongoliensis]
MRAFVITGPFQGEVQDVEPPVPKPGEVIVRVERAGVCGTDAEFFTGEMAYLHDGQARYPLRIGHEWCGVVTALGAGVSGEWLGRRVTGDTMLGCQRCARCQGGRQHLCAERFEIGIRYGHPGALAEFLPVPAFALHALPDDVGPVLGAMVEPGGNALRAVQAARLRPGQKLLILGPGTIGLLAAMFAVAEGVEVHLLGLSPVFARSLGFTCHTEVPDLPFDAVIDASNSADLPALAAEKVEPGGRVVYIGLAGEPSLVDTRVIALKDLRVTGVLSASGGLAGTIERYASGAVDPSPLVAATIGLDDVAGVLAEKRNPDRPPKIHIDPVSG